MDLATLLGLIISIVVVILGIFTTGLAPGQIIDIASVFITVGGSFATVMASNPLEITKNIWTIYKKAFQVPKYNLKEKITQLVTFAEKARREGLLALEDDLENLDEPFLRKALQLVVDGTDPELVRNVMLIEIEALEERHGKNRAWFDSLSTLAPAFGMLGTLIGLVGMLQNLGGDVSIIGKGMATALITTLYGSFISNVIAIPTSNKLRHRTEEEILVKQLMLEGTMSIQAGDNPRIIKEKLLSYLAPSQRQEIEQEE